MRDSSPVQLFSNSNNLFKQRTKIICFPLNSLNDAFLLHLTILTKPSSLNQPWQCSLIAYIERRRATIYVHLHDVIFSDRSTHSTPDLIRTDFSWEEPVVFMELWPELKYFQLKTNLASHMEGIHLWYLHIFLKTNSPVQPCTHYNLWNLI